MVISKKVSGYASFKVVENKTLLCNSCIIGENIRSNTVLCHLHPVAEEKPANHFCAQGHWFLDGKTLSFTQAWEYVNETGQV